MWLQRSSFVLEQSGYSLEKYGWDLKTLFSSTLYVASACGGDRGRRAGEDFFPFDEIAGEDFLVYLSFFFGANGIH